MSTSKSRALALLLALSWASAVLAAPPSHEGRNKDLDQTTSPRDAESKADPKFWQLADFPAFKGWCESLNLPYPCRWTLRKSALEKIKAEGLPEFVLLYFSHDEEVPGENEAFIKLLEKEIPGVSVIPIPGFLPNSFTPGTLTGIFWTLLKVYILLIRNYASC